LVAAVLAAALVVAGCGGGGGGGDEAAGGGGSLSKAEFLKQADAVCSAGKTKVRAEYQAYLTKNKIEEGKESKAENEAHVTEIAETIAFPALRQQIEEIRALGAPEGEEAEVKAFLDATEAEVKEAEEDPQSLLASSNEVFAKSDKLAEEYGFKVCGQRE
jgi:hypothetical protein